MKNQILMSIIPPPIALIASILIQYTNISQNYFPYYTLIALVFSILLIGIGFSILVIINAKKVFQKAIGYAVIFLNLFLFLPVCFAIYGFINKIPNY